MFGHYVAQLQRRSGRRVFLSIVVRLFDKRVVTFDRGKQLRGVFRQTIEEIDADREIRAINECAVVLGDDLSRLRFVLFPTSCTFGEGHLCAHTSFDVLEHCIAGGEIDRRVVTAKFFRQLIERKILISARHDGADLVAPFTRFGGNHVAHRAVSDQCQFHDLSFFASST